MSAHLKAQLLRFVRTTGLAFAASLLPVAPVPTVTSEPAPPGAAP